MDIYTEYALKSILTLSYEKGVPNKYQPELSSSSFRGSQDHWGMGNNMPSIFHWDREDTTNQEIFSPSLLHLKQAIIIDKEE